MLGSFVLVLTIGACGDSMAPGEASLQPAVGAYDLIRVNGAPPPIVQGTIIITAATLTLEADGSAELVFRVSDPDPRSVEVFAGRFTVSGPIITLAGTGANGYPHSYSGTVSGLVLHLDSNGSDFEFRKR
jgi:hypothetical protein